MRWKIATVVLAVALLASIGAQQWQLNHQWNRTVGSEASLFTVVQGNKVTDQQSNAKLQSQVESAISLTSGATVNGIKNLVGSVPIGNSLTGAISSLQSSVQCLETDIADIEDQATSYLVCH